MHMAFMYLACDLIYSLEQLEGCLFVFCFFLEGGVLGQHMSSCTMV